MIRPAATVLALRSGPGAMEVLMVRRTRSAVFMGGTYVFPGGAIDPVDEGPEAHVVDVADPADRRWRAAALRELAEEAGVFVTDPPPTASVVESWVGRQGAELYRAIATTGRVMPGDLLAYLSNWVTPPGPPRRFDTRFYVVTVAAGFEAQPDGIEVTAAHWVEPRRALQRAAEGVWDVPFPTARHLELLASFDHPDEVEAFARNQQDVPVVAPSLVRREDGLEIVMPEWPGVTPERR